MAHYKLLSVLLLLIPFYTQAQKIPEFYLKETRMPITKGVLKEHIPRDSFKHYSTINIAADAGNYQVDYYDISFLPARGEMLGPYKISDPKTNNIIKALNDHGATFYNRLRPGDKILIETIGAFCDECPRFKKITFKAIVILID